MSVEFSSPVVNARSVAQPLWFRLRKSKGITLSVLMC